MHLPSYLQKNQYGIYYIRIYFPQYIRLQFNKHEFKKSLKTKEKRDAVAFSRAIKIRFDLFFKKKMVFQMDWLTTKNKLNELVDEIIDRFNNDIMDLGTYGKHITNYTELLVEQEAQRFINLKSKNTPLNIESFRELKRYTEEIIDNCKLDTDPDKLERNLVQVAEMLLKLRQKRIQLVESLYLSAPFLFDEYKKQINLDELGGEAHFNSDMIDIPAISSDQKTYNSLTLRELIDKFIKYKISKGAWGSPKTIELNVQKLNYIFDFLSFIKRSDKIYIDNLNAEDAEQFEKYFQILPKNRTKKYPNTTIEELIYKSTSGSIPKNELISTVTYNSYVDLIFGMFNYAVLPKQSYIKKNYFIDLKVKPQARTKRLPFGDDDLFKFFSTDLFVKKDFLTKYSWRYWVPIIMVYSGLRLEEISQIPLKHIVIIEGISCFDIKEEFDSTNNKYITKLKNNSSKRIVPIHPEIIKLGLLKYVDYLSGLGEYNLFPHLSNLSEKDRYIKAGAKISRWFNEDDKIHYKKSYLTNCGINADNKERKVLYAFRHTVQTCLNNHPSNVEFDKIDHLFGHSVKSIGRKEYGNYKPETILNVVKLISYPKVKFPWNSSSYNKIPFPWEK